ncbi:MAG: hypothetical protein A2Z27_00485 [candidate division Zixibacteria bacterium RBG_16_50_21]|nr:MAG: hypothetical protein A2Z27_00485 [candidate division Zixibacteria bacterium RBG_16_50_21]
MPDSPQLFRRLALLLKYGSLASMAILFLGLVWSGVSPQSTLEQQRFTARYILDYLLPTSAAGTLHLGIMVLMFLPIAVVGASWAHFRQNRDRKNQRVAAMILLVLILGIFLGISQVK